MYRRLQAVAPTLAFVALAALGGCADGATRAPEVTKEPEATEAQASVDSSVATRLVLGEPVSHLDTTAREPMLLEHADGSLFVSGYQREDPRVEQAPALWKSADDGASWLRVEVGGVSDGAMGNSDVDLALAPDGTLYFATMGFDRTEAVGTHVAVGTSGDGGASWSWARLTDDRAVDRPWVVIDPNRK